MNQLNTKISVRAAHGRQQALNLPVAQLSDAVRPCIQTGAISEFKKHSIIWPVLKCVIELQSSWVWNLSPLPEM